MPSGGHNAIPEAVLIDALRQLADDLGRSPSQTDINEHSEHSHKTYYRKFDGGLAEAKERAGVEHYTAASDVERVNVECGNCGAKLERTPSKVKANEFCYCDRECYHEHQQDRYSGDGNPAWNSREVECETCGTAFYQFEARIKNRENLFCSRGCYGKWRSENVVGEKHPRWKEYPRLGCEYCGRPYTVVPAEEQQSRFCSKSCQWSFLGEMKSGQKHYKWQGDDEELECSNCGKTFHVRPWQSPGRKYCSRECYYQGMSGENHPRYLGESTARNSKDYLGPYWQEERVAAIIRDQARCQEEGCRIPEHRHLEKYGVGLHVHHITDRRKFTKDGEFDHAAANKLNNLITLCTSHHMQRHG